MPGRYWLLSKVSAALREHVGDRLDRAFGGHHHAGADVEDLDDVGRLPARKAAMPAFSVSG